MQGLLLIGHPHDYGEAARSNTCFFINYGLAWSSKSGLVSALHLIMVFILS